MRLEKVHKRGLKRLFTGILVTALLVTLLPFENMGSFVSSAAVTTPTGSAVFEEYEITATPILVGDAETLVNSLQQYKVAEEETGIILQLTADINLGSYSGINFFAGNVGIDLDGYTITGLSEDSILQPEVVQSANLVFIGSADGSKQGKITFSGWVTDTLKYDNEAWQIYNGQNIAFSNVTLENVDIIANAGSSVGDDGIRESVPISETTDTIVCYRQGEGASTYSVVSEEMDTYVSHKLYMTDFEACTGATQIDISKRSLMEGYGTSEIEYDISILEKLPSELIYDNGEYVASYSKPSASFKVDEVYGFYSVTTEADEEVMTIYGLFDDGYSYNSMDLTLTSDKTEATADAYMRIDKVFANLETDQPYKKVVFAKGAIPAQYRNTNYYKDEENPNDSGNKWITNTLIEIIISGVSSDTTIEFDLNEREDISVFNDSGALVNFIDDASANNKLYVGIQDYGIVNSTEQGETYYNPVKVDYALEMNSAMDTQYYVLAGSAITFTVEEGYTIYNVQIGDFYPEYGETQDISSYIYYNGRREGAENFTYQTNGTIEATVPNYSFAFCYSASKILDVTYELEDPYFMIDGTMIAETDGGGAYKDIFKIVGAKSNLVWDGKDTTTWTKEVQIAEEGMNVNKELYLLDQLMVEDLDDIDGDGITTELIASETYGRRSYLSYMYCLDLQSPVIQSVVVTDQNGEIVEGFPTGSWVEAPSVEGGDGATTFADGTEDIYWTNKESLTFTVTPSDTDTSTELSGYAYTQGGDVAELPWNYSTEEDPGNTYSVSGDGQYELHFYVRDDFDEYFNRATAGSWVTTFAIDTVAPVVTYTDATVTQAAVLSSGSSHTGNLYLNISDDASGLDLSTELDAITLYVVEADVPTARPELLLKATDGRYYIKQTANETTYILEVKDIAGNISTYENFIIEGYEHDITVEAGGDVGYYKEGQQIMLYINNASVIDINNLKYDLASGATNTYFEGITGTLATVPSEGETQLTINLSANAPVGSYEVDLTFAYTTDAERPEEQIEKVYNFTATGEIVRMEATEDMYTISTPEDKESGWYKKGATITAAEGYALSTTEEGTYSQTLTIDQTTYNYTFYVKRDAGAISDAVVIESIKVDNSGPSITYTDAVSPAKTTLAGSASYEGNLYLTIEDSGVGFESISLYQYENNAWVGDAVALKNTDTIGVYYIVPQATDAVYKIEVKDILGNVTTYENITVKAYIPDVEITTDIDSVEYGVEGLITITIKNTGSVEIANVVYKLNESEVQNAFEVLEGTIDSIAAGATETITVATFPSNNLGTYVAPLELTYTSNGATQETIINKAYSQDISITIVQAEGTGTVEIQDYYYGEEVSLLVNSDTNGNETYTVYYKNAEDETAEFTQNVPTEAGKYIVRVVFDATTNYKEVIAENTFNIFRLVPTSDMYIYGEETNDTGWILSDVIITAQDGYTISVTEDGTFTDTLTISETVESYTFYVKTETGAVTEAVVLGAFQIDKTAPEITESEGIYVVKTWWQKFLETITFNVYQSETEQIEIKAHDDESGMAQISYYVSTEAISAEDITEIEDWTEGTELTINRGDYEQFVVYAKLENNAGLITYISTDGIIMEEVPAPEEPETPVEPEIPVEPETPVEPEIPVEPETPTIVKIDAGKVALQKGVAYQLEEGIWNVVGDDTDYVGSIVFYVDEDGEYEFVQKQEEE